MTENDNTTSSRQQSEMSVFHFDEGYASARLGMSMGSDNPYIEDLEPVAYSSWVAGFLKGRASFGH
jgi:hypothetical protein